jgi:hypothetical protein
MIVMLERGEANSDRRLGERAGDSSTTRCSTIKAQKDAKRNGERDALYIYLIRPLSEDQE